MTGWEREGGVEEGSGGGGLCGLGGTRAFGGRGGTQGTLGHLSLEGGSSDRQLGYYLFI